MNDLFTNGTPLSWAAFLLLGVWRVYWYISAQKAESAKPKEKEALPPFHKRNLSKYVTLGAFGIVCVQLLGVSILELPVKSVMLPVIGFVLVIVGLCTAIVGRYNLGTNWANCYEYQVKKKQQLVTHGIYAYIRHPLYSGIAIFFIGSELIVQSYLVFIYFLAFFAAFKQGKWEEKLLISHFGNTYRSYMKRTKMFIPFIW